VVVEVTVVGEVVEVVEVEVVVVVVGGGQPGVVGFVTHCCSAADTTVTPGSVEYTLIGSLRPEVLLCPFAQYTNAIAYRETAKVPPTLLVIAISCVPE